jgi:diguanylate cyclase (GGDEF)-like protein
MPGAAAQSVAALLLLAGLSYAAGATTFPVAILYAFWVLYASLRLGRTQLVVLGIAALVTHGTALFMLVDRTGTLSVTGAWLQIAGLLVALAGAIAFAGMLARLRERLAEARRELHDLKIEADDRASRDALTGVYHHRHLLEALEREISRSERIGKPLSVARVDLDWLGKLNETHGHATGDIALKKFTAAATDALRDVDVFGRYGGNEFLALMPDTDLKGAVIAAERLRAAVSREPVPEVNGRRQLSCTLGVAEHRKGENTRLLIGRAEAGLNYAKAAGGDQVVALDPASGEPILVESR